MEDENEYKKLPIEEKCVHKLWKARVTGYEEAIKCFNQIDDEKSPEWNKYVGLIKKFVTDSNAVAQEKGLEAALVFAENCFHAGKTTADVMSGVVTKCIAAPKTKTKDLAMQLTLMYIEVEKQDAVQEELMKGMEHKNPKIVSACVAALTSALKQFGNKVIQIKPLVKKIPALLTDRDKGVRDEGKALVVEMQRWIGAAIEPHIAPLQAVVQQELRDAFAGNTGATPTRFLRSQQSKMAEVAAREDNVDGGEEDECDAGAGDTGDTDPYDLLDPVDVLGKLPKDFYEKLEAKKWQERKEALDALENLLKMSPKLEAGDYADLVRALKKVISKDSNVMLVALAGRELGLVAAGLRNKFQPYAVACTAAILEKFKEKKTNVVSALREAIDAIYPCTNLEAILEDVTEAFNNKNPAVRSETALFLARAWCRTTRAALTKKLLKAYVGGLLKLLESADPTVRDAAAEALGTATKLVGEKNIAPHVGKLDPLKEAKIKEFQDKAVIQVKVAGPKEVKKPAPAAKGDGKAGSAQPKPVRRPAGGAKKPAAAVKKTEKAIAREAELSQDEVDRQAEEFFGSETVSGLQDSDWKTRLNSVRSFQQTVCGLTPADTSAQVLLRTLNKKPGLRDTNMQVLKARIHVLKYIAENFPLSTTSVDFVLSDIVTRLGEATVMLSAQDVLSTFSEAELCGLEHVVREALSHAMDSQKNPKVQLELFNWLTNAIQEFGLSMDVKPLMAHAKKAISATNPNVRTAAINFLGVLSMYTGPSLLSHFDSEKPQLKQLIQSEMDKYANNTRPSPVRGVLKSSSKNSVAEESEDQFEECEDAPVPAPAAAPPSSAETARSDLALLVTEPLLAEINDKNWKVRAEGLEKLSNMISSAAPIKPSLGELPAALTARLLDSNLKLAQTAQQICEALAVAMGPRCKTHARTFFPAFFQALGDSKAWIRAGGVACLDTWSAQAGGAHVALEGEMVLDALRTGSPTLRAELLQWLADNLPDVAPKSFAREELSQCVPLLYSCIEDRSAEVRRKAGDCVLPFMLHLGYESMHKMLDKLKPGSKTVVLAALDKARPSLPVQPLPSKGKKEDPKAVKTGGAQKKEAEKKGEKKGVPTPQGKTKGAAKPASARAKKDDDDLAPLLPNNNAKNQRIVDDQKLKVLKWNFVTPREEFFELLKDQMLSTGFQKQLVQNMFHNDFRYHLKALESLGEDLSENGPALQANLDLVLKWLTLRFFDTNPSVILKGLEYLSAVFNYLIDSDYTMAEYEANCFIPYLVLKVGDPKDSVRNGVKALFKQICVVYSVTKLFGYLMEGLKSKNARQRSECLECIGHLLETYGSGVMSPSIGLALKELARHIGDRDNAVRSAALNCIAHAYFLEGERIYKMIGQVSDKDQSLLEERIKRAAKTRSAENRKSMLQPLSSTGRPLVRQPSDLEPEDEPAQQITVEAMTPNGNDEEEQETRGPTTVTVKNPKFALGPPGGAGDAKQQSPTVFAANGDESNSPAPPQPSVVPGPFGLDPEVLARLEAQKPRTERAEFRPRPDTSFLDEPIPNFRPVYTVQQATVNTNVMSPPHRLTAPSAFGAQPSQPIDDSLLVDIIQSISSPNLNTASRGLKMINSALTSGRGAALRSYEERLVRAVTQQVRQLRTGGHGGDEAADMYRLLAALLASLYETGGLGGGVSASGAGALLSELLRVLSAADMADGLGQLMDRRDADKLVRVLNVVCVRVLERTDRTAMLCALITLLHETIGQQSAQLPRYQELLLKCFWKALKMFPQWAPDSVDYDAVLYKVHSFYQTFPASYWKKNPDVSDTPYRTVKTCVHSLVKAKGPSILNHLTQIPDAQNTDLHAYLLKVFQQLKMDPKAASAEPAGGGGGGGGARLSRDVHEELIQVLGSISSRPSNHQEAFAKLLDIKERHPEVDMWSSMQGSTFHFRSYVERGLVEAAERRRFPRHTLRDNDENENEDEDDDNMHLVYMEKLRKLQAKAGIPLSQSNFPRAADPAGLEPAPLSTRYIDPQFELRAAAQPSCPAEGQVDVEALKMKLQQIKNAARR